jgi:hypothetical protein
MITMVHIYTSHVTDGHHLKVLSRDTGPLAEGAVHGEQVLEHNLKSHNIVSFHVWDGCEIVVREVARPAAED